MERINDEMELSSKGGELSTDEWECHWPDSKTKLRFPLCSLLLLHVHDGYDSGGVWNFHFLIEKIYHGHCNDEDDDDFEECCWYADMMKNVHHFYPDLTQYSFDVDEDGKKGK